VASERPDPLDLTVPRDFSTLLSATLRIFGRHAEVFLTAALIFVTPVTLLVDGVWGRALAEGIDASAPVEADGVSAGLRVFVILPLVTAMNVVIVQGLAHGTTPTVGWALRTAARRLPPVVGAVTLYVLGVMAGFVALIVPGIWLAVRWYFAAQAVVIDGVGPGEALRRSSQLVKGTWWRTAGMLLGTGLLFAFAGSIVVAILGALGSAPVYVAGLILVEAVAVSLSGIFGTLLFFDLRARRGSPETGAGPAGDGLDAPERPDAGVR
jgi:hypothetical protein